MAKPASPKRARDVGGNSGSKGRKATSTGKISGSQGKQPEDMPADAIALLEADHRAVEQLFGDFDQEKGDAGQRDIANAICIALKIHARLEEELFYPAAAQVLDEPSMIMEAMVEHATAKDLIAQIETGAPGQPIFEARVKVLSEYVAHHVAEEEGELFPRCRDSALDLDALGAVMALRKQELSAGFVASNPVIGLANARADANA
jgi:hemerythrin superfamily protein